MPETRDTNNVGTEPTQAYRSKTAAGRVTWLRVLGVVGYCVVQPIVLLVVFNVLLTDFGRTGDISLYLPDREELAVVVPVGLLLLALQIGLVLPAFPSRRSFGRPTWLRCLGTGLGIGSVLGVAVGIGAMALNLPVYLGLDWFSQEPGAFYLCVLLTLVFAGVVAVAMRVYCRDGVPLALSVAVAAFLAAALVAGFVMLAIEAVDMVVAHIDPNAREISEEVMFGAAFAATAIGWIIFTPLLVSLKKGQALDTFISRLAKRLFVGTVIEIAAAVPLDIMVRRKTDCYCSEDTFWSLVVAFSAGFIVMGPLVVLLPLGRRFKRVSTGRCWSCDFDMRGCMTAKCCPECGAAWAAPSLAGEPGAAATKPPQERS